MLYDIFTQHFETNFEENFEIQIYILHVVIFDCEFSVYIQKQEWSCKTQTFSKNENVKGLSSRAT
jgi:hypothetical protein